MTADPAQVAEHLRRRLVAVGRVLGHQLHDQAVELGGDLGPAHRQADRDVLDVLQRHRERRLALERGDAREHLIERHAQRIQVAAVVERLALRLLGAHVQRGAHRHAGLGHLEAVGVLIAAEAEVGDLDLTLPGQQDVLGLDVAMDQAELARHADGHARPAS